MLVKIFPYCLTIKYHCFALFAWKYLSALSSIVINNISVVGTTVLLHYRHTHIKKQTCLDRNNILHFIMLYLHFYKTFFNLN